MRGLPALILVALLAAGAASAGITGTGQPDADLLIEYDAATTASVTVRSFTTNTTGDLYAQLLAFQDSPWADGDPDWTVDMVLQDAAGNNTSLATDHNGTGPTPSLTVPAGDYSLRFTWHYPATREAGLEVRAGVVIAQEAGDPDGNESGGIQDPSIGHVASFYYYDPTDDSDGDGLRDGCEIQAFGDLDEHPGNDPDMDGYTNKEECDAGSNPNDKNSHPATPVIGGGSGGSINDRETGWFLGGLVIFLLAIFLAVWIGVRAKTEQRATWIIGSIAVALLASFAVLVVLDYMALTSVQWAFWVHAGLSWTEWVATSLAVSTILLAGIFTMMRMPQSKEHGYAIGALVAAIVTVVLAVILFGPVGVELPWGA